MKLIARGNCEIEVINSKFKLSLICVRNSFFFFFFFFEKVIPITKTSKESQQLDVYAFLIAFTG
jgi:hypothetical protein